MSEVLQKRISESMGKYGSLTAIAYGDRNISYSDLDRMTRCIANEIIEKCGSGEFIGVCLNDRSAIIAAMLGIFMAGCIFVPFDTGNPPARIREMIRDIGLKHIICDNASVEYIGEIEAVSFILENDLYRHKDEYAVKPIAVTFDPDDRVYVYFTSGSTGKPKAILGRNKGLLHFIDWEISTFNLDSSFSFSQFTNPGFDVFLRDTLVPLCCGGKIVIPEQPDIILDGGRLAYWINVNKINLIHCVPSLFRQINSENLSETDFMDLRYVLLAGEKVIPSELRNWYDKIGERVQLVNLYGPTETTLAKTFYLIQKSDIERDVMPVGKPIRGARVIILDENLNVCDELVTGEIYIRTPYRTFGYLNDEELNNKKFIRNPFSKNPDDIIYRTGDLGRLLPDGNIELLGRVDRQVKIRGIRVELEEIESVFFGHHLVKDVAVIKDESPSINADVLVAFVTVKESKPGNEILMDLEKYLKDKLPVHMIPSDIVITQSIPRLANGKIDYKTLAEQRSNTIRRVPPRDDVEKKLYEIWIKLLGENTIGITDSFFKLGGSSLNLMRLISEIDKVFEVKLSLGMLFENNTIEKQAAIIKKSFSADYPGQIKPAGTREFYPLSFAQKRFYILDMMFQENTMYNLSEVVRLNGNVDIGKTENIFKELIKRHECLRAYFISMDGIPVMKIADDVHFSIEILEAGDKTGEELLAQFIRPFDLSKPPLFRVGIIKLEPENYIMAIDMHHIISDAISMNIIIKDFITLFEGKQLPPLKGRYADYAVWQESSEFEKLMEKHKKFWLSQFEDGIPVVDLPLDFPRPSVQTYEGDFQTLNLDQKEVAFLKRISSKNDTTLFVSLLAVFNILLYKITGNTDIVLGTPVSGRSHEIFENVVGMFVNTLVLRNRIDGKQSFTEFLLKVKENIRHVFNNQEYPFDELVKHVCKKRDTARNPIFDIMFQFQDFDIQEINIEGLSISPVERNLVSNFDMTFSVTKIKEDMQINIVYNKKLFKKETIQSWMGFFSRILKSISMDEEIKVNDIQHMDEKEIIKMKSLLDSYEKPLDITFDL